MHIRKETRIAILLVKEHYDGEQDCLPGKQA